MTLAKHALLVPVAFLTLSLFACVASAQDANSYPMILSASNLDAMVQGRLLTKEVTAARQNTIGSVTIGYAETQNNPPVELNVPQSYTDGKISVAIDDNLLAKIKGQPVVFDVAQRPVTEVVLRYDPPANDPVMGDSDGNGVVFIRLSSTKRMAGKVEGLNEFKLKTAFGEVTVPMAEIAGIKFHTTTDDKAVVILNNGDAITGVPTVPAVELMTDWGKADIDPEFIQSLTSTREAKFRQQNTDFGTRWVLDTGNSFAPSALQN
jgi:hypothetical protein